MKKKFSLIPILFAASFAVASCSSSEATKALDYFEANPMPSKEDMLKRFGPRPEAADGIRHSQKILDQMAKYDDPVAGPLPKSETGILSETVMQPVTDAESTLRKVQTERGEVTLPPPPPEAQKDAPKSKDKKAAAKADSAAVNLREMLEGQNVPQPSVLEDASADPTKVRQVEINFNGASLRAVIEFVFGEYIKKPYVIATDFADKEVNWVAQGEFSNQEVRRMFESFLDIQGVVIGESNGIYTVGNRGGATRIVGAGEFGNSTGIWKLKTVDANEVMQIIRPFIANSENITMIDRRNILIVNGSGSEIRYIDAFVKAVDTPLFADRRIIIYAPKHISAEGMVTLLQALPQQLGLNGTEGKKQVEAALVNGSKRVAIITDSKETRDIVMRYVDQIDQPNRNQKQVFYYALRNQVVDDVKTTLTSLMSGLLPDPLEVTIVANAPTNSLIINATPDQYFELKKVIDRLDFRVPSVLIDATIVEVQLNDNLAYGVEWFLGGRAGDVRGDITANLANAAIAAPAARIGVVSLRNNTFATLDLLASQTDLRVLSRPRVLVKNRATATIKSTDQVRIIKSVLTTSVQQGGDNIPKREFEDKEVGVSLQVTPRIAEDGTVNMQVKIQDSRQGADDDTSGERPRFNLREVNTELVSKNGETILIGGLIRNNVTRTKTKIPLLGDLPVVGQAFSNTNDADQRTELVIFLSPYLVTDEVSARLISDAVAGLAQMNPALAKNTETPDLNLHGVRDNPPAEKAPAPKSGEEAPKPADGKASDLTNPPASMFLQEDEADSAPVFHTIPPAPNEPFTGKKANALPATSGATASPIMLHEDSSSPKPENKADPVNTQILLQ